MKYFFWFVGILHVGMAIGFATGYVKPTVFAVVVTYLIAAVALFMIGAKTR